MRLSSSLLLQALISAASAISDASVYIVQGDKLPEFSTPPTLSPAEARLVFAQRLGVSEYHGLGDASEETLSYINAFGGRQESLFSDLAQDKAAELVVMVEGISSEAAEPILKRWTLNKPEFTISNPPSTSSNIRLATELQAHIGPSSSECSVEEQINPFQKNCFEGKSKIMHLDLKTIEIDFSDVLQRLIGFVKYEAMNIVLVLMPEECRTAKSSGKPYGSYAMPSQSQLSRRQQAEEPMTEEAPTFSSPVTQSKQVYASNSTGPSKPLVKVPPSCYISLDACNNSTNSCSGHGECYQKTGKTSGSTTCYACFCKPTKYFFKQGVNKVPSYRIIYWGGGACQKEDVSGPFWLFAISSVVMVGLVGWAIGMLFSIGEEKLPGVIGAGVSSGKAK